MNAKRAKALRKVASNAQRLKDLPGVTYYELSNRRKYAEVPLNLDDPTVRRGALKGALTVGSKVQVADGQVVIAPRSRRGVYLSLKRELNKEER